MSSYSTSSTTSGQPNMSPNCHQVLETAELLEGVLLQLDMATLLTTAQLVCRKWHDTIKSSPALKQALYFEPIPRALGPPTQNPLLASVFYPWFRQRLRAGRLGGPVLGGYERRSLRRLSIGSASRGYAFMHPTASWRNMLVRQPPVLKLGEWKVCRMPRYDSSTFVPHEFPDGLRMGSFYDLVLDYIWRNDARFDVLWDPTTALSYYNRLETGEGISDSIGQSQCEFFAREMDIVLYCDGLVHDPEEWRDVEFEKAFTFAPTPDKREEWEYATEQNRWIEEEASDPGEYGWDGPESQMYYDWCDSESD